ncbi:G-protein coupled receptor protein [Trichoderma novae-zelandiae]
MTRDLTEEQIKVLTIIERTNSSISMVACTFTILTFCFSKYFSKSINRLVFYASFGNLLSDIAIIMSRDFIDNPNSAGCQIQAFMIQVFLSSDVLWTLAMAINVYLTFYHKYEARDVRKLEPVYLICCYGIPLIPGFALLFAKDHNGVRIYGPAIAYCWISSDWALLRILVFYAPIWVAILVIFGIYIRAGRTIYKVRKQVYIFESSDLDPISVDETTTPIQSGDEAHTVGAMSDPERTNIDHTLSQLDIHAAGSTSESPTTSPPPIHIASNKWNQSNNSDGTHPPFYFYADTSHRGSDPPQPPRNPSHQSAASRALRTLRRRNHERDNAAWSYTKCALLFFGAMLITWIPSSANRLYSLTHNNSISVPLQFASVFVIPLQGFWNCLVYVTTSWVGCKNLFHDMWLAIRAETIDFMGRFRRRTNDEDGETR